jgi:uncharacterized protein YbjT (DUF2867 family)
MKIFVTGAAGYVGGSVSDKLVTSGHEVVGLARSGDTVPLLKARGIDSVVGTLDDVDILTKAAQAATLGRHLSHYDLRGRPGSAARQ